MLSLNWPFQMTADSWPLTGLEKDCDFRRQTDLSFCLNGVLWTTLISGHDDGTLQFRNLLSGEIHALHFHNVDIRAIALSHDGTVGVSADVDANLAVWFAETGERIGILRSMSNRPVDVGWIRPALVFTENDERFQVVYDTHNHELTVKSWLLKPTAE